MIIPKFEARSDMTEKRYPVPCKGDFLIRHASGFVRMGDLCSCISYGTISTLLLHSQAGNETILTLDYMHSKTCLGLTYWHIKQWHIIAMKFKHFNTFILFIAFCLSTKYER